MIILRPSLTVIAAIGAAGVPVRIDPRNPHRTGFAHLQKRGDFGKSKPVFVHPNEPQPKAPANVLDGFKDVAGPMEQEPAPAAQPVELPAKGVQFGPGQVGEYLRPTIIDSGKVTFAVAPIPEDLGAQHEAWEFARRVEAATYYDHAKGSFYLLPQYYDYYRSRHVSAQSSMSAQSSVSNVNSSSAADEDEGTSLEDEFEEDRFRHVSKTSSEISLVEEGEDSGMGMPDLREEYEGPTIDWMPFLHPMPGPSGLQAESGMDARNVYQMGYGVDEAGPMRRRPSGGRTFSTPYSRPASEFRRPQTPTFSATDGTFPRASAEPNVEIIAEGAEGAPEAEQGALAILEDVAEVVTDAL